MHLMSLVFQNHNIGHSGANCLAPCLPQVPHAVTPNLSRRGLSVVRGETTGEKENTVDLCGNDGT
jgi:hypothetical protein